MFWVVEASWIRMLVSDRFAVVAPRVIVLSVHDIEAMFLVIHGILIAFELRDELLDVAYNSREGWRDSLHRISVYNVTCSIAFRKCACEFNAQYIFLEFDIQFLELCMNRFECLETLHKGFLSRRLLELEHEHL